MPNQWKQISEAPKDGTWVYVFGDPLSDGGPHYGVARWEAEAREFWDRVNSNTQKRRVVEDGYWDSDVAPTHFMFLPDPPNTD